MKEDPSRKVLIAGHSLGAALGTIFTKKWITFQQNTLKRDLKSAKATIEVTHVFGSPRVAARNANPFRKGWRQVPWADAFDRDLHDVLITHTNGNDIVRRVASVVRWGHVGNKQQVYYDRRTGDMHFNMPKAQMVKAMRSGLLADLGTLMRMAFSKKKVDAKRDATRQERGLDKLLAAADQQFALDRAERRLNGGKQAIDAQQNAKGDATLNKTELQLVGDHRMDGDSGYVARTAAFASDLVKQRHGGNSVFSE
jgi:hypothetical protein